DLPALSYIPRLHPLFVNSWHAGTDAGDEFIIDTAGSLCPGIGGDTRVCTEEFDRGSYRGGRIVFAVSVEVHDKLVHGNTAGDAITLSAEPDGRTFGNARHPVGIATRDQRQPGRLLHAIGISVGDPGAFVCRFIMCHRGTKAHHGA